MTVYLNEDGSLKQEDQLLQDLDLANTLETIANDADSFYSGQLARDIIDDLTEAGGLMTLDDLKNYNVIEQVGQATSENNTVH